MISPFVPFRPPLVGEIRQRKGFRKTGRLLDGRSANHPFFFSLLLPPSRDVVMYVRRRSAKKIIFGRGVNEIGLDRAIGSSWQAAWTFSKKRVLVDGRDRLITFRPPCWVCVTGRSGQGRGAS